MKAELIAMTDINTDDYLDRIAGREVWLAYCDKKQELEAPNDEIERLREALQSLLDVQNGPPLLGRYAEEWQAAVDQARAALGEDK